MLHMYFPHSYVANSSLCVNIMIIAGALILYIVVILFGVDENIASYSTVNDLCHGRVWLSVIGFSLLVGTIIAKSWRIYYIFKHSKYTIVDASGILSLWVPFVIILLHRKSMICFYF